MFTYHDFISEAEKAVKKMYPEIDECYMIHCGIEYDELTKRQLEGKECKDEIWVCYFYELKRQPRLYKVIYHPESHRPYLWGHRYVVDEYGEYKMNARKLK